MRDLTLSSQLHEEGASTNIPILQVEELRSHYVLQAPSQSLNPDSLLPAQYSAPGLGGEVRRDEGRFQKAGVGRMLSGALFGKW